MAAASTDPFPGLFFEKTDFHQTNTHLYIFGYTSVGERGTFLRVSRALTSDNSLEIECYERQHTVESYEKELRKIHESNGGLQPVCKVCCKVPDHCGCDKWLQMSGLLHKITRALRHKSRALSCSKLMSMSSCARLCMNRCACCFCMLVHTVK